MGEHQTGPVPADSGVTAWARNSCTRLTVPIWFVRNVAHKSHRCSPRDQMMTRGMSEALKDDVQRHTQRTIFLTHRKVP